MSRPEQMTHAQMLALVDQGAVELVIEAAHRGELDDVRATLEAAQPELVAGVRQQQPDDGPGWLDH